MEWSRLLCSERLGRPDSEADPNRSIFVRDHDRIVFSAPFRRLANKTQVQPLYENDHVHHRLIHSIEVSSVARSMATRLGSWLEAEGHLSQAEANNLIDIVQAASVAHDIGNPPFGHSGEAAMGAWFEERFRAAQGVFAGVNAARHVQFTKFEGNAQGFRIISRLEMFRNEGGLRLSKATLGAFAKYPVTADVWTAVKDRTAYAGLKKFGIFKAEEELFRDVATALGLPEVSGPEGRWWRRHPLVFIVEAADDICYNIVDLEDAFTTGEVPFDTVRDLLHKAAGDGHRDIDDLNKPEQIAALRGFAIGRAIESCVDAFRDNYAALMEGAFSSSLIEAGAVAGIFADMKDLSRDQVFTARRKTELEVSGRRVIANVMSGLLPVFDDLAGVGWNPAGLSEYHRQLVRALGLDLRDVTTPEQALHALADFTSGMTDRYAVRVARMLTGT